MIKEAKHIDFYTSGKQLSIQDFARISEWIRKNKKNEIIAPTKKSIPKKHSLYAKV